MAVKQLKFHIASDDYFGTLATILDLLVQGRKSEKNAPEVKILAKTVKDLVYLQKNYRIVKK